MLNFNYFSIRAELGLCMYQLENLVQEQLPELHLHFQSQVCCGFLQIPSNSKNFHENFRAFKLRCMLRAGS